MNGGDRIDEYLDALFARLHGRSAASRSMLVEAEAHLRDAAAASVAAGVPEDAAQEAAIAAFGSPAQVAKAAEGRSAGELVLALTRAAVTLCAAGFAAIALATILARVVSFVTSTSWVYGAPGTDRFTTEQCAHWLAVQPGAATCKAAATLEASDDSFLFSLAAAFGGLVLIGLVAAVLLLVRRFGRMPRRRVPPIVVFAIGATAFGGAGAALLVCGTADVAVGGQWGQGLWYTQGAVALAFGVYFAARLLVATSHSLTPERVR
jgi:hypothetical protein